MNDFRQPTKLSYTYKISYVVSATPTAGDLLKRRLTTANVERLGPPLFLASICPVSLERVSSNLSLLLLHKIVQVSAQDIKVIGQVQLPELRQGRCQGRIPLGGLRAGNACRQLSSCFEQRCGLFGGESSVRSNSPQAAFILRTDALAGHAADEAD